MFYFDFINVCDFRKKRRGPPVTIGDTVTQQEENLLSRLQREAVTTVKGLKNIVVKVGRRL